MKQPRILVLRLRRFGDILLTTPLLRAIRRALPMCQLDVVVSAGFEGAVKGNPHVDAVHVLRRGMAGWLALVGRWQAQRYDVVLDLQSSSRTALLALASRARQRIGWRKRWIRDRVYTHLLPGWDEEVYFARKMLRALAPLGITDDVDLHPELAISAADRARAAALLDPATSSGRPLVALSVVANVVWKRWSEEQYATLADRLIAEHDAQLVLTHGPGELSQVRGVVERMRVVPALWHYGDTSLAELGALYERCDLWMGNDGGPKHVATAAGCPTITVIKSRDACVWIDAADPAQVAMRPRGEEDSILEVTVDDMCAAASECLRRSAGRSRVSRAGQPRSG